MYTLVRKSYVPNLLFGEAMNMHATAVSSQGYRKVIDMLACEHRDSATLEQALRRAFPTATVVRAEVTPLLGTKRIVSVTISAPNFYCGETIRFD